MIRIAAFVLAGLVLGACESPSPYRWQKEGVSKALVEDARVQCKTEARSYGFLDGADRSERVPTARGDRYSNVEARTAQREADIFGDCMRALGYSLGRTEGAN